MWLKDEILRQFKADEPDSVANFNNKSLSRAIGHITDDITSIIDQNVDDEGHINWDTIEKTTKSAISEIADECIVFAESLATFNNEQGKFMGELADIAAYFLKDKDPVFVDTKNLEVFHWCGSTFADDEWDYFELAKSSIIFFNNEEARTAYKLKYGV
jgi:hypothetical protein